MACTSASHETEVYLRKYFGAFANICISHRTLTYSKYIHSKRGTWKRKAKQERKIRKKDAVREGEKVRIES